jgi:hypothetical protein
MLAVPTCRGLKILYLWRNLWRYPENKMNPDSIRHSEREVVLHETKESGSALELHPLHNTDSIIWLKRSNITVDKSSTFIKSYIWHGTELEAIRKIRACAIRS